MSRFPAVTETFILREMIAMERQSQRVLPVPVLREVPPVIHDAAAPWIERAVYSPFFNWEIAAANLRAFAARPLHFTKLFARLVAGTMARPGTLLRTVAVFPKSVWLAERLAKEGVRHVHAHYATHPATMALIVSELSPITFSITVHAHDIQLDRSLLRWKLRRARFVRSISDYNRRFLETLYPETRGKIDVIHVGVDTARRHPHPEAENEVPRILSVAAYKPYKGLPVLIEACRLLREEGRRFHCLLVGHGPMESELRALVRKCGVDDCVTIAGPRAESEVGRLMSESDLFVLPSVVAADGQMEGIPVALMEAMFAERPVISTTISGIPELIEHRVSGLLVPPQDAKALAAAMRSILDNPSLAQRLGRRAREKVMSEFSLADCTARLLARIDLENRA